MTKILVVDEDLVVLATVSMGLRQAGYEVIQVDTGIAALNVLKRDKPDLVVADIRMPELDGIELARQLRSTFGIPFIFLTAFSNDEMVRAAADAGALGYLVKPLEIARIVPAIETALCRADEVAALRLEIANLTEAVDRNRDIDVAIGLIMERYRIPRRDAFESLRRHARDNRAKVAEVARRVIDGEHFRPQPLED
jgi:response regulator NasT